MHRHVWTYWALMLGLALAVAHSVDDVEDRLVAEGLATPSLQRKRAV